MSGSSKIEWTEVTWNPITGCTPFSAGCKHCYAARFAKRLKAMGNPRYQNGFSVTVHEDLFEAPLSWSGSKMVFVNSMSDLFHESISEDTILRLFDIMNRAENHTFQVLTKRSKRLAELSSKIIWTSNIWMGVSVEDKESMYRVDDLKKATPMTRFVSAEPLLEDISEIDLDGIDWLIVGGESGPGCRPIEEEWVVNLKNKAYDSGVAFFFYLWGGVNKKKNGSLLQGKEYKEYPVNRKTVM